MFYSTEEQYWIWLSSVEEIGPITFFKLLNVYESAHSVWDALAEKGIPAKMAFLNKSTWKHLKAARDEAYLFRLFDRLDRTGIRALTRLSEDYPAQLMPIPAPPPTLYTLGFGTLDDPRMFAIVGSRRCTRDGQRAAREIARNLTEAGVTVVSGMARGTDTCAHEGCLSAGGRTIAVLGNGLDMAYPPENRELMDRIIDGGGMVVSEYPPGVAPLPRHFPARNRIISGLARGTLLIEGAERSGAMITINHALEQGKDVFALPGSVFSPVSVAPNRLIVDGAIPALSHTEILDYYRWSEPSGRKGEPPAEEVQLSDDERALVEPMRDQELSFEELRQLTGFSAQKINSHLTMLELRGIIVKVPGGMYRAYL